ncbi:hypothetical protein A3A03_03630 [Candidatus Nomurabacteria bacterium RIFCSPLOWO2_01_FULL_40_18]|uniref:Carboxypeptidase regulatory-like domain-containing protein n=1 Tax=Candidatus Nomurabacteria bacterium RIFCSPLOWO2_01_FULL_40_18 TaxID=1801773 RepID=A0A1F6XI94_9BACT|nr:MAG: hypothetical protein A3A03_03630 [Candidatus Nomurabacteria bacterium RIFCSPLOWO2_01_FULL_40_18]
MAKKLFRAKLVFLRSFAVFSVLFFLTFSFTHFALASETNGTIDGTYKYAWGENIGWINFGCDNCNVRVTDESVVGKAWSSQYGWINLSPTTSGITNDAEGTLSGFAWSPNLGWINFDGVTINSGGEFMGYATLESDSSRINFNCANADSCSGANFKVKTDWRPASVRPSPTSGSRPVPPITPPTLPPTLPPILPPTTITPVITPATTPVLAPSLSWLDRIFNFFNPKKEPAPAIVEIPKIAPFAFQLRWNLLPVEAIRSFVFVPLPYEVRILAGKFPELNQTLQSVGINRMTDLSKLTGVSLNLPGLTELTNTLRGVGAERLAEINKLSGVALDLPGLLDISGTLGSKVGAGKIALVKGLPLSKFSLSAKKNLPGEFVFARVAGELVDLNVAMSIGDKGEVAQRISTLPGQTMRLVVKPISSARSVTGYFVFKSATPRITKNNISRSSLSASALFSLNDLVEKNPEPLGHSPTGEPISVENKLVLSSFEYTDPDHDGIYTADVVTPTTPGEYEVITVIAYIDPVLGTRQMRLITVIDPEGYVFEKRDGKETRIPSAIVSLYALNTSTKKYELWGAKEYSQENPQVTDVRGTYSFLVPEGSYYFSVEAPGYDLYQGKAFIVLEGNGIHQNIELKSGKGWFSSLDWKTILLIVVFLLLVYNIYSSRKQKQ